MFCLEPYFFSDSIQLETYKNYLENEERDQNTLHLEYIEYFNKQKEDLHVCKT